MPEMKKKSRFLARVLRHEPGLAFLDLDAGGWAREADILNGFRSAGVPLTRLELREIVDSDDKKRFTRQGERIRAAQGHSISVDLGLPAKKPPVRLLHGTATTRIDSILRTGLNAAKRNYVHLNLDATTALEVGRRHGRPVILKVAAGRMHQEGFRFYLSENGLWLTECVPPEFLSVHVYESDFLADMASAAA
ncbi:RNA 2'-phosphotransferase [Roseivivax sp. CAU 1761]